MWKRFTPLLFCLFVELIHFASLVAFSGRPAEEKNASMTRIFRGRSSHTIVNKVFANVELHNHDDIFFNCIIIKLCYFLKIKNYNMLSHYLFVFYVLNAKFTPFLFQICQNHGIILIMVLDGMSKKTEKLIKPRKPNRDKKTD